MYKITLNDGTTLENLELNGNNFIASAVVDDAVFKDNMATVTITNLEDESTEQIEDGVLLSNIVRDGKSWLVLGQKTPCNGCSSDWEGGVNHGHFASRH